MADPRCRHVPPCPDLPAHQGWQRDEVRRARAARAAVLRNQRGRRRAVSPGVLPGMIRLPATTREKEA